LDEEELSAVAEVVKERLVAIEAEIARHRVSESVLREKYHLTEALAKFREVVPNA
jgi:hypothetical protein